MNAKKQGKKGKGQNKFAAKHDKHLGALQASNGKGQGSQIQESLEELGVPEGGYTVPNTHTKSWTYDGTSSTYDNTALLIDAIVADCYRVRDDSYSWAPGNLKLYCLWAVYSRIKKVGQLGGTFGRIMPVMPDHCVIPRALFSMLKYLGKYDYCGSKYGVTFKLTNEPALTKRGISNLSGYTGVSFGQNQIIPWKYNGTQKEWYIGDDTVSTTMSNIIDDYDAISEFVESIQLGIPFGELSEKAPDASFYAWTSGSKSWVYSSIPDFNMVYGALFGTNMASSLYAPRYRKPLPEATYDFSSANMNPAWIHSNVFITNRMDNQSLKIKNGWNYAGKKLADPCGVYVDQFTYQFNTVCAAYLMEYGNLGVTAEEAFIFFYLWKAAFIRRIFEFCALTTTDSGQLNWQQYNPPANYRSLKVPIIIAHVLDSIGPTVDRETLYLPSIPIPDFETVGSTFDEFPLNQYVGGNSDPLAAPTIFNEFGVYIDTGANIILGGGVTINAAWLTAMTSAMTLWPRNLLPQFLEKYNAASDRLSMTSFVSRASPALGGPNMLVDGDIRYFTTGNFGSYTVATHFVVVQIALCAGIRSYTPLGGKDLVSCMFYCRELEKSANVYIEANPFLYTQSNNGYDYDSWARIKALVRDTVRSSSDFSYTLGQARAKQKSVAVKIGTLEAPLTSNQSWWESILGGAMNVVSSQMAAFSATTALGYGLYAARARIESARMAYNDGTAQAQQTVSNTVGNLAGVAIANAYRFLSHRQGGSTMPSSVVINEIS